MLKRNFFILNKALGVKGHKKARTTRDIEGDLPRLVPAGLTLLNAAVMDLGESAGGVVNR